MGIFGRLGDIIKANINDMLDKAEDPEKMIKQMILEMEDALKEGTSGVAEAMANQKSLERQLAAHKQESASWEQKAMQALKADKEDLARKALAEKADSDKQVVQYEKLVATATDTVTKLRAQLEQLKDKLQDAKAKEQLLIARSKTAKASKEVAEKLGGMDDSGFSKFDKFEQKIEKTEAEAELLSGEDSESVQTKKAFDEMEKTAAVDDELAKLKEKMKNEGQ
jgi:phage shock protein A